MPDLVMVYIAHPLGAGLDRATNRGRAAAWVAFLAERYLIAPVCTWITLAEVWPETMRDLGLEIDRALIESVGLVILCGPRISDGMRAESGWARRVIDLTGPGRVLPRHLTAGELEAIDARMAEAGILRRAA
jgi:hypothetical protein